MTMTTTTSPTAPTLKQVAAARATWHRASDRLVAALHAQHADGSGAYDQAVMAAARTAEQARQALEAAVVARATTRDAGC